MRKELINSLGGEWEVAVNNEINKLKQSDKLLLGDVAAVFARSDSFLGRPEADCNEENEAFYAIFYPSKYSIVANKDFGSLANAGSKWKLMSLNEFIEQVLEFNFTYLQLLYNNSTIYESDDVKNFRNKVNELIKDEYNYNRFIRKQVSLMYGVLSDFNNGKFRDVPYIKDRVFLVTRVMKLVDDFVNTSKISLDTNIDLVEYNKMVRNGVIDGKLKYIVLGELNSRTANYSARYNVENIRFIDKDELRCYKIKAKYDIMRSTTDKILKEA